MRRFIPCWRNVLSSVAIAGSLLLLLATTYNQFDVVKDLRTVAIVFFVAIACQWGRSKVIKEIEQLDG